MPGVVAATSARPGHEARYGPVSGRAGMSPVRTDEADTRVSSPTVVGACAAQASPATIAPHGVARGSLLSGGRPGAGCRGPRPRRRTAARIRTIPHRGPTRPARHRATETRHSNGQGRSTVRAQGRLARSCGYVHQRRTPTSAGPRRSTGDDAGSPGPDARTTTRPRALPDADTAESRVTQGAKQPKGVRNRGRLGSSTYITGTQIGC